ncbi:hypothetical protein [Daejeonella sp. H1SJ63]|jgi:hypothetical protein|uniref:hypothetical protein n=1 Tax=Daejeonella sp. H1SJ63 TaxID=3034145 RepID=UPI0023EDF2A0|nr:hypothetical protein [Daejeonella sp. H1SJ63]
MSKKKTEMIVGEADSFPINEIIESNPSFTRREMLGIGGIAGLTALTGFSTDALGRTQQRKPRVAVLATYWAATRSHADWLVNKLIDGYWWQGAHLDSGIEIVSVYLHQHDASQLGQKVAKAKGIPVYRSVAEAVTLGGKELAVDGVVIVGEHGDYATDMKGHWLLPRWWLYNQVIRVFEQSKRSVPVFNDKHLSYNWDDAKWMFDKSRELGFPLTGGSLLPVYYRKPEIELKNDTPIKHSIVVGATPDEGAIFHCIELLQAFNERRKGGETGVKSIQSIRGPEAWKWVESNSWAGKLLDAVAKSLDFKPGHFQSAPRTNICIIEYNDGTQAAIIGSQGAGWTYAGEIEGQNEPTIVSLLNFPGPFDQYHASNAQPHWIVEMMLTKKEPFNAERLLLTTGITNQYMESNWEGSKYSPVGRRIETPFLNMTYRPTRGAQFNKGQRPPARPYIRGFSQ